MADEKGSRLGKAGIEVLKLLNKLRDEGIHIKLKAGNRKPYHVIIQDIEK